MLTPEQIQEVRNKVWLADQAMAQRDHELFCQRIWEVTEHAIKCDAKEREWPCQTFDEVWEAGRRLAKESGNEFGWTAAAGGEPQGRVEVVRLVTAGGLLLFAAALAWMFLSGLFASMYVQGRAALDDAGG